MKKISVLAVLLCAAMCAFAQGNGMQGITDATNMVTGYFDDTKLFYILQTTTMQNDDKQ